LEQVAGVARVDVRGIRRDQILEAAERVVSDKGWADTTFADLCQEAGVSNGTLTHSFKNKDEILLALWERCAERHARLIAERLSSDAPVEQAHADIVRAVREKTGAEKRLFLLVLHYLAEATGDRDLAQRMAEHFRRTRALSVERLRAGQTSGEVRAEIDPDAAAALLQWVGIGVSLGTVTGVIDPSAADDLSEFIRRYLSPTPSA
jgi:AcrR family transcriptional regulator